MCNKSKMTGFTLLEVMIAILIMAMIAIMTSQAFTAAIKSSEATEEAIDRMAAVDRIWVLFENDIRNAIPAMPNVFREKLIPPLYIDASDHYRMTLLRAGYANPLHLPRTEVVRIGYRIEENTLWRDTWIDIGESDERKAKPQKILTRIEEIYIKVLPSQGATVLGGPWLERWPQDGQNPQNLPSAVEITLKLDDMGEVKRLYSFLPGLDNHLAPIIPGQQGNPNNPNNSGNNNGVNN